MNTEKLWRVFFPLKCPQCGKIIPLDRNFCSCFSTEIITVGNDFCPHCGADKENCVCVYNKNNYKTASVFYYSGEIRARLLNLKFNSIRSETKYFAPRMAHRFTEVFPDVKADVVTFVPMTEFAEKKRGFNQSEMLCDGVAKVLKLPSIELLQKLKETDNQHTLNQTQRRANLNDCFFAVDKNDINGKTIILVDDIKTTGTTLSKCADVLMNSGAKAVYCLVAAVSQFNKDLF